MAKREQCKQCKFCDLMSQDLGQGKLHIYCSYQDRQLVADQYECDDFEQVEYDTDCWDDNGVFKDEYYWKLRKQVTVGSIYYGSFDNRFGISNKAVLDFFEGYEEYLSEMMEEEHGADFCYEVLFSDYDNENNLLGYVGMFEEEIFTRDLVGK